LLWASHQGTILELVSLIFQLGIACPRFLMYRGGKPDFDLNDGSHYPSPQCDFEVIDGRNLLGRMVECGFTYPSLSNLVITYFSNVFEESSVSLWPAINKPFRYVALFSTVECGLDLALGS
jgi:hypothetical protein